MKPRIYKKTTVEPESFRVNTSNTPYLVIVESPSKCLKIEKYLGFQYKCIASKGHLREITKVMSAKHQYTPVFGIISEKSSHVEWMKQAVSCFEPQNIFLGTDDDREGEAIAWHICQVCGLDIEKTPRILFHEITENALKLAVKSPLRIRMNIVRAQQARQILDRLIGFKISPVLSRMLVHDNSKFLSAGRCQTPTLRLVYDKHKENIEKEQKVQYKIQGIFFKHPSNLQTTLELVIDSELQVRDFLERSMQHSHKLHIDDKKTKTSSPPKPFNTSHLLQTVSSLLHISPKHTMDICQKLYQDGKITYMRTESTKYANTFVQQLNTYITDAYGEDYLGDLKNITNFDNQNPHEAIRVTQIGMEHPEYSDKKINDVYRLIWKRTMESSMKQYIFDEYNIFISAPVSKYKAAIQIPLFLGWKRVSTTLDKMREEQQKLSTDISFYKNYLGKIIPYQKIDATLFMKDIDKYYQEASIIQKLESLGIGRPSTYSMLIDTIQERKYVLKQNIEGEEFHGNEFTLGIDGYVVNPVSKIFGAAKNKLKIQDLGMQAIDVLWTYFEPLFEYSYTSKMEKELDTFITDPTKRIEDVCADCESVINTCLKPLLNKMKQSYKLDNNHELVFGKAGMMIKMTQTINNETKTSFKSIKPAFELNFEKLENNQYTLEDLVELKDDCLGIFENESLYLKSGPYGAYVIWGENKFSLPNSVNKLSLADITKDIVISAIEQHRQKEPKKTILREINEYTSVRKGQYGQYIYYKTDKMKKPKFINLKKCPHNVLEDSSDVILEWIHTNEK